MKEAALTNLLDVRYKRTSSRTIVTNSDASQCSSDSVLCCVWFSGDVPDASENRPSGLDPGDKHRGCTSSSTDVLTVRHYGQWFWFIIISYCVSEDDISLMKAHQVKDELTLAWQDSSRSAQASSPWSSYLSITTFISLHCHWTGLQPC